MKVKDLINKLEDFQKEYGENIDVIVCSDNGAWFNHYSIYASTRNETDLVPAIVIQHLSRIKEYEANQNDRKPI